MNGLGWGLEEGLNEPHDRDRLDVGQRAVLKFREQMAAHMPLKVVRGLWPGPRFLHGYELLGRLAEINLIERVSVGEERTCGSPCLHQGHSGIVADDFAHAPLRRNDN